MDKVHVLLLSFYHVPAAYLESQEEPELLMTFPFEELTGLLSKQDMVSQLFSSNYVIRSWDISKRYVIYGARN
jgi:hypothetical protein